MGSLAPGTTSYPFVINKEGKTLLMMFDLGNKLWSLLLICLIIGKAVGGKDLSMLNLIKKTIKMPIVIAFSAAITFILIGIKVEKDMKITGLFCVKISKITSPFMLFFIGL